MYTDGQRGRASGDFSDQQLWQLLERDRARQHGTLALVASSSVAPWQVLACNGSRLSNITGEGYPGARFHSGCTDFDDVERLAVTRARRAFGASFANVQPHSGTNANLAALTALAPVGGRVLSMSLDAGGHLSHGARASITSTLFEVSHYGVGATGYIDYEQVAEHADRFRPHVIVAGASCYPRVIDFARFRAIADGVGAVVLADISHIAGLVVTGLHPSPIPFAHVTTTSTYKQLAGPRGGLVLGGSDVPDPVDLERRVARAVFPGVQGTPQANTIAAKAWAMRYVTSVDFHDVCRRIASSARAVADQLADRGLRTLTGGTDNHMVVVDLTDQRMTGWVAERALEACDLLVNRNSIPGDPLPPTLTSGIRLGTNSLAARGGGPGEGRAAAEVIGDVVAALTVDGPRSYRLPPGVARQAQAAVREIIRGFDGAALDATRVDMVGADA